MSDQLQQMVAVRCPHCKTRFIVDAAELPELMATCPNTTCGQRLNVLANEVPYERPNRTRRRAP